MEEIKRLVEARQVEAMKKQLSQKLVCIVKYLGSNVYSQFGYGSGYSANTYNSESYILDDETQGIPEATDDEYNQVGYIYDALSIGKNLEIRYMDIDKELRVTYNSDVVYLEMDGQLKKYVPSTVWEVVVERLYDKAKPIEVDKKAIEKEEGNKSFMKQAAKFLKELRDSWGF